MPMKLNIAVAKKLGLPDYGSIGATCGVEVELPGSLIFDDLEAFHRNVRNAYVACSQAVGDELARQRQAEGSAQPTDAASSGRLAGATNANENGNGRTNGGHQASQKQMDYVNQFARQIRGLGTRRVKTLADTMFGKPLADLTSFEASGLIDTIKSIKSGDIDLDAALNGAAA
jgi:hypothetical protein